jgi:hypothetical protein
MAKFRKAEPITGEKCPRPGCGVGVQRTKDGTQVDGFRAHYKTVHPEVGLAGMEDEVGGLTPVQDDDDD